MKTLTVAVLIAATLVDPFHWTPAIVIGVTVSSWCWRAAAIVITAIALAGLTNVLAGPIQDPPVFSFGRELFVGGISLGLSSLLVSWPTSALSFRSRKHDA